VPRIEKVINEGMG